MLYAIVIFTLLTNYKVHSREKYRGAKLHWEPVESSSSPCIYRTCAAVLRGAGALWHAMRKTGEMRWMNDRGAKRWLEEHTLLSGGGSLRELLSSLQGLSSTELISVEMWMDRSQEARGEGGEVLLVWGGSVRIQCHENRIWGDEFPPQGLGASFQTSLSPLCYSVRTHSSTSPPTSKPQDASEKPVGYGTCGMHIPTVPTGITAHGCWIFQNDPNSFLWWCTCRYICIFIHIVLNKHCKSNTKLLSLIFYELLTYISCWLLWSCTDGGPAFHCSDMFSGGSLCECCTSPVTATAGQDGWTDGYYLITFFNYKVLKIICSHFCNLVIYPSHDLHTVIQTCLEAKSQWILIFESPYPQNHHLIISLYLNKHVTTNCPLICLVWHKNITSMKPWLSMQWSIPACSDVPLCCSSLCICSSLWKNAQYFSDLIPAHIHE